MLRSLVQALGEPNVPLTNGIFKRNLPSKLWGASIKGGASARDITVILQ